MARPKKFVVRFHVRKKKRNGGGVVFFLLLPPVRTFVSKSDREKESEKKEGYADMQCKKRILKK